MYQQLKQRLAEMLRRPRLLKPQTQRQIASHLAEHNADLRSLLLCAADVLEDYELDVVFGPVFTPTIEERAELADLLFHWHPTQQQVAQIIHELAAELPHAVVRLPDGEQASLSLHEVMVDRFVRLLRLEQGPEPSLAAALRDAVPPGLWKLGIALLCERGMTAQHQKWLVDFINHISRRRQLTAELMRTAAEFLAAQPSLEAADLLSAAEALLRATRQTAAYASGGHAYWSPDVAQHHQYRGQGRVDQQQMAQRQAEVEHVAMLLDELRSFIAEQPAR
jgi:hypothetical protein